MRDPLWSAVAKPPLSSRTTKAAALLPHSIALLRLGLLAEMPYRTALNPRSRLAEMLWRLRTGDPFAAIANPQVRTMLEAMGRVYTPRA
jgi:hypothetical protein